MSGRPLCAHARHHGPDGAQRRPRREDGLWPATRHLPALGHPVPAAVIAAGAHGHLLAAQCPREADPEVLGVTQLGLGLRDLWGSSQATGRPGPGRPRPRPAPQGLAGRGSLTSFSRAPVGGFSGSTSLLQRCFSSDPGPWGFTLGFPQPWMTWGDHGVLEGHEAGPGAPLPRPPRPPARTLAVSVSLLSWRALMASASHTCTLPRTRSAPDGPRSLSVMSTVESGTGASTERTWYVCARPPTPTRQRTRAATHAHAGQAHVRSRSRPGADVCARRLALSQLTDALALVHRRARRARVCAFAAHWHTRPARHARAAHSHASARYMRAHRAITCTHEHVCGGTCWSMGSRVPHVGMLSHLMSACVRVCPRVNAVHAGSPPASKHVHTRACVLVYTLVAPSRQHMCMLACTCWYAHDWSTMWQYVHVLPDPPYASNARVSPPCHGHAGTRASWSITCHTHVGMFVY